MRKVVSIVSVGLGIVAGLTATVGAQEASLDGRPHGTYVFKPDLPTATPRVARSGPALTIYMNRNGGTIYPGNDDSSNQVSSIPNSVSNMGAYSYGDASWSEVMTCIKDIYAPFNIEVTDVRPASGTYIECMTSGNPQDVGMGANVGGVSPYNCGFIPQAIVYDFAEVWGGDTRAICETAAQETAHAFGLDHEFYCPDPMTYLTGCGDKYFRDYTAQCGTYSAQNCLCGGTTQNSYQSILSMFGARPTVPPTVSITSPMDGATVQAGFVVNVDATDDVSVAHVELWIDGTLAKTDDIAPYGFVAPDLASGSHSIVARAIDGQGNLADSAAITVNLKGPCTGNGDCNGSEVCQVSTGACVPGPTATGGLGADCVMNSDCISMECDSDGTNMKCAQPCDAADPTACPDGFACTSGVCWPSSGHGNNGASGGCSVGADHDNTMSLVWFGFGFVGIVLLARRRRR